MVGKVGRNKKKGCMISGGNNERRGRIRDERGTRGSAGKLRDGK